MVAGGQNRPRPACHAIHGPGEAGADRLHSPPEGIAVLRLDDQVRVIALQRVVHETEARPFAPGGEGALDLVDDPNGAERGYVATDPQRDVRRQPGERAPAAMERPGILPGFARPSRGVRPSAGARAARDRVEESDETS